MRRQVRDVDLVLASDRALDGPAVVEPEAHVHFEVGILHVQPRVFLAQQQLRLALRGQRSRCQQARAAEGPRAIRTERNSLMVSMKLLSA